MMMDEGVDRIKAAYRDNYGRLVVVKNRYDPTNLFHVNQNVKELTLSHRRSQPIAIGIDNNGVFGPDRAGPRNMRRAPMVLKTAAVRRPTDTVSGTLATQRNGQQIHDAQAGFDRVCFRSLLGSEAHATRQR